MRLQATTTSNVVTYEVVIDAPNEDLKLKPGLTANITIITEAANDVLMVPVKALSFKPTLPEKPDMPQPPVAQGQPDSIASKRPALQANEKIIFIKDAQGMHPQKVEIGMTNGIYTEIKNGLALGDTIVTDQIAELDLPAPAGKMGGSPFMPQPPGRNRKR